MADVLIADNSPFSRRLLCDVIGEDHDVVAEVENGVEAVEVCRERRPDLVVMAASMPIRDGIEATREIRADGPDASVLVCVGAAGEETEREAREAGADVLVAKPFRKPSLLAAVRDAVRA